MALSPAQAAVQSTNQSFRMHSHSPNKSCFPVPLRNLWSNIASDDSSRNRWKSYPIRRLRGFQLSLFHMQIKIPLPLAEMRFFDSSTYRIAGNKVVKRSSKVRLTEALTMDFIAKNTTIPVPKVFDVFEFNGIPCLVQEFIDGSVLEDIWSKLNLDEKEHAILQLKGFMDQLRSLPPPNPGRVEAVDGRGFVNPRRETGEWGPFENPEEFSNFSWHGHIKRNFDRYPGSAQIYAKIAGRSYRTVFSHGDIGPHNLLWKDGRIVAMIDWEYAGWFPEYFDFTQTAAVCIDSGRKARDEFWQLFAKVVDSYPDELEVEQYSLGYQETW